MRIGVHCKYITCKNTTFRCCFSHALPVPFWHLITVPSTGDHISSCIFGGKKSYQCSSYTSTHSVYINLLLLNHYDFNHCKSISKNTTFCGISKKQRFRGMKMAIFHIFKCKLPTIRTSYLI